MEEFWDKRRQKKASISSEKLRREGGQTFLQPPEAIHPALQNKGLMRRQGGVGSILSSVL